MTRTKATAFIMIFSVVLAACRSNKPAATTPKPYERKPIVETTDEALKSETAMIAAKMALETGHTDEACRALRDLANTPQGFAAAYELSRVMAANGQSDSAIILANKACQGDPDNVWYSLHAAALYRATNRKTEYIKTWEHIVNRHPDVIDYCHELCNAYLLNNDYKKAVDALNRIENRVGVTEQVSLQKSQIWNAAGRSDKALAEIEKLAKTMPQETRYYSLLAETYMSMGQYDKAKKCFDRIVASNPNDEYVHISLAEYYKAAKQPRKAYEELRIAMAQRNLTTSNKLHILTSFYTSEEFYGIHSAYAFDLLDVAMRNCDDSTSFAAFYGDVLMRQKKYDEAVRQFLLYLSVESSKYDIWEALLVCELSTNTNTDTLAAHAQRAASLFPLHNLPYYTHAVAEHDKEHFPEAVELAKKCESIGFDNGFLEAETYMLIAECYNRMDDSSCYAYFERYLAIYPNDMITANSYAYRLALDRRHLDKALLLSRKTIDKEPNNPHYLDTYAWILHGMGNDSEALRYIKQAMAAGGNSEEVIEHFKEIFKATEQ